MDMHYNPTWLHQTSADPAQHNSLLHEGRMQNDGWKERTTTNDTGDGNSSAQAALDLSEFGIPDITAASSSNSPPPFYGHTFPNNFYITPSSPSYNTVAYGSPPWPNASSQVPLSNYSSLNGATTTMSSSQQQQQQSMQPQPMMIDPSLTGSSNGIQQYSPSLNYPPPSIQHQHQPQRQPTFQFQQQLHPSSLSINPSYVHSSYYPTQQQGTLSPHALHSPSVLSGMPPSAFSSEALPSSSSNKVEFEAAIKPLLQASAFTGAGAVHNLVSIINNHGSQDVDAATRLEIVTKIRDKAGNHYFRAWAENAVAIDITREWLKAAFTANPDSSLAETVMPLLHIIDRLPLTLDSLKASKLGKIVVKLVKDPPTPAIKDMASNVERRWRQMLNDGGSKNDTNTEDARSKKRKSSEPPTSKAPPPSKRPATTVSASRPVSKETKVTAVKDAKSDSSFFSAPKPKPKLPSFKKAPPPVVKKEPDLNVAQPSSIDPFQEALKSMAKTRKESPAVSTPPPTTPANVPQGKTSTGLTKSGKRKKFVTWAPEGHLESIRLIEKAIYDDDPVDGIHTSHSLRDLDRGEGAALHAHLFEEVVDWSEPILVDIPAEIELRARGEESEEKNTQEEREQTALGALYMSPSHIPDSPGEPLSVIPEEEVDKDVRTMTCGPDVDPVFWGPAVIETSSSVADLMGQLAAGTAAGQMAVPLNGHGAGLKPFGLDLGGLPSAASIQSLPPEQLQQLLAQLTQQTGLTGQTNMQTGYGDHESWGQTYSEYPSQQGYNENDQHEGRQWSAEGGGRGRGRGRGGHVNGGGFKHSKRKPCSYFAAGRCRFGDQCDFSHEPVGYQ